MVLRLRRAVVDTLVIWLDAIFSPWQMKMVLFIITGRILLPFFNKLLANDSLKVRNLLLQYSLAATGTVTLGYFLGANFNDPRLPLVWGLGVLNAVGLYYYWQAAEISLSRTSLLTQLDDLTAIALGYLVLHEGRFVSRWAFVGTAAAFAAAVMFASARSQTTQVAARRGWDWDWNSDNMRMLECVVLYSGMWGFIMFSRRYFAWTEMSLWSFIAAFYSGSFVTAAAIYLWKSRAELVDLAKQGKRALPMGRRLMYVSGSCVLAVIPAILGYWIAKTVPVVVFQPVDQVAEVICPTLVGLLGFGEMKKLTGFGWLAVAVGVMGGLITALTF